ncbi:hypothetical protein WMY93_008189 [Mugilogobius chulae]|uniref:Uncharacterized protein n=1 Tax=Mugilogobius chulae TaxID=88201 RepID=A0AAW0PF80_9GOBI
MEKQTLEENILQLHNKIANFQNNFVDASCALVPSPLAQANAQLEVALQNEARAISRVSELETENNKLQVHLLDKETKEKQLQDQLNTRIKELEAELLAEKKVSQTNSHLHEQKMTALVQKNQELEEALRNAGKCEQTNAASCSQQDQTEKTANTEEEAVNRTVDQASKCEGLEELDTSYKQIQEQLRAKQTGKVVCIDQLNALIYAHNKVCVENVRLRAELNQNVANHDEIKTKNNEEEAVNQTCTSEEQTTQNQLLEQLRKEERAKMVYKDQVDALSYTQYYICVENVRLRAELNQANQKYDDLLKEFNKKEENKDLKRENNILKCENQDLREDKNQTENTEEEVVTRTVDQASKCEDLEKSKITNTQLQEQLRAEEQAKLYYKKHLDACSFANRQMYAENQKLRVQQVSTFDILEKFKTANILLCERLNAEQRGRIYFENQLHACNSAYHQISEEHEKLRAELNQYVLKHSKDRADIEALREKAQRDKDLLSGELRKANQKSELLKTQLNKTKHEAQQEKEALKSLVDDLKIQLSQEKNDKEKGQDQVRKLEQTLEKERHAFTETIKRCFAAYQAAAANSS